MKILFIGGTGVLSSACSELAVRNGIDLFHLNRGKTSLRRKVEGITTIISDIRNFEETKSALKNHLFDAVVDFISFEPEHIKNNIRLFSGKTNQFVFISSASVYQTPPENLPITENTPIYNPIWEYSQKKITCENILQEENLKNGFPYTIVRPSHTYDKTLIPIKGGYTSLHRMKRGLPVIVHGDGTSIWTITHHKDFSVGLVGLLGKSESINEAFHITNDEWLSWNNIYEIIAKELGIIPNLVHIPSHIIARYDKDIGDSLLGDKAHSKLFDNTKIKKLVPEYNPKISFHDGIKEIIRWYNKPQNQIIDEAFNKLTEKIIADFS